MKPPASTKLATPPSSRSWIRPSRRKNGPGPSAGSLFWPSRCLRYCSAFCWPTSLKASSGQKKIHTLPPNGTCSKPTYGVEASSNGPPPSRVSHVIPPHPRLAWFGEVHPEVRQKVYPTHVIDLIAFSASRLF